MIEFFIGYMFLVQLWWVVMFDMVDVFIKLEGQNFGGSIKDCIVLGLV